MKIKTSILQNMVSIAIQGSSNNRMIPISSLMGIELVNGTLTLTTTDGSNQLRVNAKIENTEEMETSFYTIVDAEIFSKLVSKTTKPTITLKNENNWLLVEGNGTYKLDIPVNEEGEIIRFPDIKEITTESCPIETELLQYAITTAKASVAKTMEAPYLTGYYIADDIIATDRQMACRVGAKLVKEPILLSNEIAELLMLVEDKEINLLKEGNNLLFVTPNITIACKELEGKEMYPVQQINGLLETQYTNTIKVNKQDLLSVLDRMGLFVTDYDNNGVKLVINASGLAIQSQKSNAMEYIDILPSDKPIYEFDCLIDIEMFKAQVETISSEKVQIAYGEEKSIKLVDGATTLIIALLDKTN